MSHLLVGWASGLSFHQQQRQSIPPTATTIHNAPSGDERSFNHLIVPTGSGSFTAVSASFHRNQRSERSAAGAAL